MHSKINQVKINCLITCQYRQKQWHVDHAQLRMPADTLSSWYVPTYANTRPALDTCLHMQKHFTPSMHQDMQPLIHADTCRYTQRAYMPSTWYVVTYEELCTHKCMQLHAKAKNANSCSSPWYKPTNSGTCSALCVQTPAIVRRYIHSLWCFLTQADTWHDQPKSMLICAKSWADAYTCRHTQSPQWMARCQDTNTTPNARQPMQIHAQLSTRANSC
jgi:hypothetical protein